MRPVFFSRPVEAGNLIAAISKDDRSKELAMEAGKLPKSKGETSTMIDVLTPYILRQQRIGEAHAGIRNEFNLYFKGRFSPEWSGEELGISLDEFVSAAQGWMDSGKKDSYIDELLYRNSFPFTLPTI